MSTGQPAFVDEHVLRAVAAAVGASDLARAAHLAGGAIARGMRHPALFNARALRAQEENRLEDALDDFQTALALAPRNPTLLNAIGLCLGRLNRLHDSVSAFDAALAIAPADAVTHYRKGWTLELANESEAARLCYERALRLKPDLYEAWSALAVIAARASKPKEARELANRALRYDPAEPTAVIALAMADLADGAYEAAEQRLRTRLADPTLPPHPQAVMLGFLGDALDGQDLRNEAFATYQRRNEQFRQLYRDTLAEERRAKPVMDKLIAYFDAASPEPWQVIEPGGAPDGTAPRAHIFLMGFIRSGTTLLEQVLSQSPDVEKLEERETLADLTPRYLMRDENIDRLATLSGADLEEARGLYWQRVRGYGAKPDGKVFIDKQPLNAFNLPLISKLFPRAKVLFALRDPRDVILSCFRRHFQTNPNTFELLSLEDAAAFYGAIMHLTDIYRAKLPLNVCEHRYEDMISDFEGSIRRVCDFIGLEWTDTMRDFAQSAAAGKIRSPSAAQVRRGLYAEGVGQWRRYADHMAPILPMLQPWVTKFGYDEKIA